MRIKSTLEATEKIINDFESAKYRADALFKPSRDDKFIVYTKENTWYSSRKLVQIDLLSNKKYESNDYDSTITSCEYSVDSSILALGCENGKMFLCNTVDLGPIEKYSKINKGHFSDDDEDVLAKKVFRITSLAFSSDSKYLASSSVDSTVRIWDLDAPTSDDMMKYITIKHEAVVNGVHFTQQDQFIVTICEDSVLRLWKFGLDMTIPTKSIDLHSTPLCSVFSSNFSKFAVGFADGSVKIWNGIEYFSSQSTKVLSGQRGKILRVNFSKNCEVLSSTSNNNTLALYNLKNSTDIRIFDLQYGYFIRNDTLFVYLNPENCVMIATPAALNNDLLHIIDLLNEKGTPESIANAFEESIVSLRSRFLYDRSTYDFPLALLDVFKYTSLEIQALMRALPEMTLTVADIGLPTESPSILSVAIDRRLRHLCDFLIHRIADTFNTYNEQLDHTGDYYFDGLLIVHLIPKISAIFPDITLYILESFMLETTDGFGDLGPTSRKTFYSNSILPKKSDLVAELDLPARTRTSGLPEIANITYWRNAHMPDPLEVISECNIFQAFATQLVRAALSSRWHNVRKYFYFQLFLYLLFLGSATAFSMVIATDNISKSLSTLYADTNSQVSLAFGFLTLLLNFWFLFLELREMYLSGTSLNYWRDEWNYFEFPCHVLVIVVAILHGLRMDSEFAVATITILMIWFKLLSFFRGFRGAGVFTRLVLKILFKIRYFLLVWSVVLLGFANAYIIIFKGDNHVYGTDPTSNLRFINMGTAFVSMFKGSTGGGLDLVWRGDAQYPNGAQAGVQFPVANSDLYNLQLILFVFFSLACNVLLLNILIALMSSVYAEVNDIAAEQYRLDKTLLMLTLERNFLGNDKKASKKRYLHVVAPKGSDFWSSEGTIMAIVKNTENTINTIAESINKISVTNSSEFESKISALEQKLTEQSNILSQKIDKLLSLHAERPTGFN